MDEKQAAAPARSANPLGPEFLKNPYAFYRRLRDADPVHRSTVVPGAWFLTRYKDVVAVLKDTRFARFYMADFFRNEYGDGPLSQTYSRWVLFRDPPAQTKLHALINKAFTPKVIDAVRPRIQAYVDELLVTLAGRDTFDLLEDVAWPLPVLVICDMLGVPSEEIDLFKRWSHVIGRSVDPVPDPSIKAIANDVVRDISDYFDKQVAAREREPTDDLLSGLVHAELNGERLSREDLIANVIFLFAAGHETTVNVIGSGMLALLEHPEQLARLRADPSLIQTAVEECLRWDPPVQMTGRAAIEDVELDGRQIKRGERIFAVLGAANRDPEIFPDPDRFDITRTPNRHLSFSSGIHFCVGAQLARAEAQIAIATMVRRLPRLALADAEGPRRWRDMMILRGLESLPARR